MAGGTLNADAAPVGEEGPSLASPTGANTALDASGATPALSMPVAPSTDAPQAPAPPKRSLLVANLPTLSQAGMPAEPYSSRGSTW